MSKRKSCLNCYYADPNKCFDCGQEVERERTDEILERLLREYDKKGLNWSVNIIQEIRKKIGKPEKEAKK